VKSYLPELDQLIDKEPDSQLTELRDRELRLLLATERNLPLQVAVEADSFEEL
jgi:hypothetical protein